MAGLEFRVNFGRPKGVERVDAQIRAAILRSIVESTVSRVQARVAHPAAQALRVDSINQWAAGISGPRGGPGPIYPVTARALRFTPKGGSVVFAKSVMGKGLGPLIEAEAGRVQSGDLG